MKEKQTIFIAIVATSMIGGIIWWMRNRSRSKLRGSVKYTGPTSTSRAADLRILSPQEERIRIHADNLIRKGRVTQAAQMLEQVGLHRLAISALEDAKLIDEAARVLIRLQKPGRAAVVYSRHGWWHQAAQCFLQADAPLDAARCLREAGSFGEAGEIFAKEKKFSDAAECLGKAGQFAEAARNWIRAKTPQRAVECWISMAIDPNLMAVFKPTNEEIEIIFSEVKSGSSHPGLLNHLAKSSQVTSMIMELLTMNRSDAAASLFEKAPPHTGSSLLAEVNVQSPAGPGLAALFLDTKQYQFAGMILEQLTLFIEASDAYKSAGDHDRARYCLERISSKNPSAKSELILKTVEKPVSIDPPRQESRRANFIIESSANSTEAAAALDGSSDPKGQGPATRDIPSIPGAKTPSSIGALTTDEATLISRSWLFNGASEDDVETLIGFFKARDLKAGETVIVGDSNSFLVLVAHGNLRLGQIRAPNGDWLSPEVALSEAIPVTWDAETSSRILEIRTLDVDRVFRQNSDLTRTVYTNLTQKLLANNSNLLNLKAI